MVQTVLISTGLTQGLDEQKVNLVINYLSPCGNWKMEVHQSQTIGCACICIQQCGSAFQPERSCISFAVWSYRDKKFPEKLISILTPRFSKWKSWDSDQDFEGTLKVQCKIPGNIHARLPQLNSIQQKHDNSFNKNCNNTK